MSLILKDLRDKQLKRLLNVVRSEWCVCMSAWVWNLKLHLTPSKLIVKSSEAIPLNPHDVVCIGSGSKLTFAKGISNQSSEGVSHGISHSLYFVVNGGPSGEGGAQV